MSLQAFQVPPMPYGPATASGSATTTATGTNRGANALSWVTAIGNLGVNVLSTLTGNPAQQNTTINQAPATAPATSGSNNTMYWVLGGVLLLVIVMLYFMFRKNAK